MKIETKFLLAMLAVMPVTANADIPYRVEQTVMPQSDQIQELGRFYVGGAYNLSGWNGYVDDDGVALRGRTTSSFDVVAGGRVTDIFRIEANYARTVANWDAFDLVADTAMVNFILDARIDALYQLFYNQRIVPYVGLGGGAAWNTVDGTSVKHDISPVVAALAGVGFELGPWFTLDIGYRYMYMFTPQFDYVADFAPIAHQLRAGVRLNF